MFPKHPCRDCSSYYCAEGSEKWEWDTDEDGTPDASDQCANDPAKIEPGVCGCGIADSDSDGDTVVVQTASNQYHSAIFITGSDPRGTDNGDRSDEETLRLTMPGVRQWLEAVGGQLEEMERNINDGSYEKAVQGIQTIAKQKASIEESFLKSYIEDQLQNHTAIGWFVGLANKTKKPKTEINMPWKIWPGPCRFFPPL